MVNITVKSMKGFGTITTFKNGETLGVTTSERTYLFEVGDTLKMCFMGIPPFKYEAFCLGISPLPACDETQASLFKVKCHEYTILSTDTDQIFEVYFGFDILTTSIIGLGSYYLYKKYKKK